MSAPKRTSYSAHFKLQVINHSRNVSQADAARIFNINKSQISRWVKNAELISMADPTHKRLKSMSEKCPSISSKYSELDSEDDTVCGLLDAHDYDVKDLSLKCPESPDLSAFRPEPIVQKRTLQPIASYSTIINHQMDQLEIAKARILDAQQGRENAKRLLSFLQS